MIRINLLAVERPRRRRRGVVIPPAHRVTIGASLILIATVLGIGWWFCRCAQQLRAARRGHRQRREPRPRKLRSVLAQVQKFEARKAQLQQRVTLIEQLRRGQSAPVHVLDEISKSLPDRLWLTELTQTGSDFTLSGFAASLPSLSDFVANLEATQWFKRPVEILDSQVQTDAKAGDLVQVLGQGAVQQSRSAGAAAGAAGRRGRGAGEVRRSQRRGRRHRYATGNSWNLSLSKLPWYGQIGAFVVVCGGAVFGFWNFYVSEMQADIDAAPDAADGAARRHRARRGDGAAAAASSRRRSTQLEQRLENLRQVLPEEKDVADILRRIQGLATQSNLSDSALHAAAAGAADALRGDSVQAAGRGHVPQPRALLRSHQQVPANHQRRRDLDQGARRRPSRTPRSSRSAWRRRSCCRRPPPEPRRAATVVPKQPSAEK